MYYKVATVTLPRRAILRTYAGICQPCVTDVAQALKAGGSAQLAKRLAGQSRDDGPHYVNAIIEHVFEQRRMRLDGRLPRRTSSVHLFRDLDAARSFRAEFRAPDSPIYAVTLHGVSAAHHTWMEWTNATLLDPSGDFKDQVEKLDSAADAYWKGLRPPAAVRSESLVQGVVRISGVVGEA